VVEMGETPSLSETRYIANSLFSERKRKSISEKINRFVTGFKVKRTYPIAFFASSVISYLRGFLFGFPSLTPCLSSIGQITLENWVPKDALSALPK